MRNALIAAIVSAIVASAGAGAVDTSTPDGLAISVLQERVSTLESGTVAENAAVRRKLRIMVRCLGREEAEENACVAAAVKSGRLP